MTEVNCSELEISQQEIWRTMGVKNNDPDDLMLGLIEEMSREIFAVVKPRYTYIYIDSVDFKYGKIIKDGLKDAERYAIVVSTVGEELDKLLAGYQQTDIVKAFVVDAIASEMAEAVQRVAIKHITSELSAGENMSNPYSPGYCGWLLKEQTKLFAHFDSAPCGIVLNDSCLMLPIKSISSIIGIGTKVVKAPYGCDICTKTDCYKKKESFKNSLK